MKVYSIFFTILVSSVWTLKTQAQTNVFPGSGNVGVGTSSPQYLMDIKKAAETNTPENIVQYSISDAPDESLRIKNVTGINGNFVPWIEGYRNKSDNYSLGFSATISESSLDVGNKPMMRFDSRLSSGPLVKRPLFSWGSYTSNYMIMTANGNLGIGTDIPKEKLSVKGKIQAQEIKVTTAVADWPDYVFEDDYRLKSIEELESFVKTNKHLPGMPTANEVEVNGVQLGEMVKKLLKNNEELTLHVISLQKQIDDLKKNK